MDWRTLSKAYDLTIPDHRHKNCLTVKKPEDRIMTITTGSNEYGPSTWIKEEIKNIVEPKTNIKPDPFQVELYDTIGVAATRVDEALNKLQTAITNNSDICRTNPITVNVDKKEKENNMKDRFAITNDPNPKYEEIKDVLNVTSMAIDHSPYAAPTVRIEGYIPIGLTEKKKEYNTMYKKNESKFPQCKGIIRRNNTTRVDWADGTRTIIVLEEGREDMDMFHTFCIAFTKKMLGSTTAILNTIKECDTDAVEKARKEAIEKANREAEEETKKLKAEIEAAAFERAVQEKMFEERVIEEAIRRISIQEERRINREDPVESFQVIDVRAVEVKEEKTDETRE